MSLTFSTRRRIAFAALAPALLVGPLIAPIGADAADGGGGWTVSAGNASAGRVVLGIGDSEGPVSYKTSGGLNLGCQHDTLALRVTAGDPEGRLALRAGPGGASGCLGPFGLQLGATGLSTAVFHPEQVTGSVVTGTIRKIDVLFKDANGQCSLRTTGTLRAKYDNATQTFTYLPPPVGSTKPGNLLTIVDVQGCFGQASNGQHTYPSASYKVTADNASFNPVKITRAQ